MTWELKPARDAFPSFAAEWDRLNREIYDSHPMFDSRFIGPLLEFFGQGDELLCIHRNTAETDGALILCPKGFGRWALFLPGQMQAGTVLLRDARLLENLFGALPGFVWSIDLLAIDPDYAPNWAGLRLPRTITPHTLTMAVNLEGGFDNYWEARPRQLAKNMRRYQLRTEKWPGATSLVIIADTNQMGDAITRYGMLETSGWKGKAGTAVSINNLQGKFYRAALSAFASSNQARVIELHVGGKLAASRLMIIGNQMWVILKTAYDQSLAAVAPGRQLLKETLQQIFSEREAGSVEFYTDASRDQAEWATSLRYIHHHQLYRGDVSATLHSLAKSIRASLSRPATVQGNKDKPDRISIQSHQNISGLPDDAIRLFDDFSCRNVEFSAGWFDNLQKTVFPDDPGVRYFVAESDGQPTAILPLRLIHQGWARTIHSLSNYYTSIYSPILAKRSTADDLSRLLKQAVADGSGAHIMRFLPMDPDSPGFEAQLTALRSIGWVPFRFYCFGNWFLKVDKTWPEYLKERKSTLRSTIKRMKKKLEAEAGTLEIVTEPALVEPAIQAFNDVYVTSWKKPEPYPDFVPGLIRWLAARGAVRLGIARLDGQPIAAQLWIVSHGKAHIFKVAYDEAFSRFSPGTLLTALLMEHVIDHDKVSEVDYLIGDDAYKKSWMNHRRERWGIVAYNPKTLVGLVLLIRESAGRIARRAIKIVRSVRGD